MPPLIMPFTSASPDRPMILSVISGTPTKSDNMSAGGRLGNPNVIPKKTRKTIVKTTATDIFIPLTLC